MNLIEGLQEEMNRVREIVTEYEAIPAGRFAAEMMKNAIKQAEETIATGDTIEMMRSLKSLQSFEL